MQRYHDALESAVTPTTCSHLLLVATGISIRQKLNIVRELGRWPVSLYFGAAVIVRLYFECNSTVNTKKNKVGACLAYFTKTCHVITICFKISQENSISEV